jgi:hypothetical protein
VELYLFILLLALAWFWFAGARAREQVVVAARRACTHHGLQLLDETVLLERMRPRRGGDGRLRWRREYSFEFSGEGELRQHGRVVLFGGRIVDLTLSLPEGTLYDTQ